MCNVEDTCTSRGRIGEMRVKNSVLTSLRCDRDSDWDHDDEAVLRVGVSGPPGHHEPPFHEACEALHAARHAATAFLVGRRHTPHRKAARPAVACASDSSNGGKHWICD